MPLPAAATALGPAVIGGISSLIGGAESDKRARREAKKQRAFQERMRNTQWQAAVSDMTAAGINPAIAYSKGPAAAPGGAMAPQKDIVSPAVSSAMQMRRMTADLENIQKQNELLDAQKDKTEGERGRIDVELAGYGAEWDERSERFVIKMPWKQNRRTREIESLIQRNLSETALKQIMGRAGEPIAELADRFGWLLPIAAGGARFGSGLLSGAAGLRRSLRAPSKQWSQMLHKTWRKGKQTFRSTIRR